MTMIRGYMTKIHGTKKPQLIEFEGVFEPVGDDDSGFLMFEYHNRLYQINLEDNSLQVQGTGGKYDFADLPRYYEAYENLRYKFF